MRSYLALATLATAAMVQAAEHLVQVGANNSLSFDPSSIFTNPGDLVIFQFVGKNHSVVQTSFAAPCTKASDGFDSGFVNVPSDQTANFTQMTFSVNDNSSFWFSCAQTQPLNHCEAGMVFAVNANASGNTFDAFQKAAMALNGTTPSGTSTGSQPTKSNGAMPALGNKGMLSAGLVAVAALAASFAL